MVYVVGYKNPDLDSVAAAIALAELKEKVEKGEFVAAWVGKPTVEASYFLEKFGVEPPAHLDASKIGSSDRVILVDHNEETHRMSGLDPTCIIEIIDHHYRIDLKFNQPIKILIYPWGASATIIFSLAQQNKVSFSPKVAKLLLAAILSDTLGLQSPTTTNHDRDAAEKLRKLAQIKDLEALTHEILRAKSNTSGLTPKQVILNDHKCYNFSGRKVLISQLETLEQEKVLTKKGMYLAAMRGVKQEKNLDFLFFAITDPLRKNTKILYPAQEEQITLEKAFRAKGEEGVVDVGPRLSRKKEIAPAIEDAIAQKS